MPKYPLHWFHWLYQVAVNHIQFFPHQKNSPSSHNSLLDMESAVAPAGLRTCFIHPSSNGAIQKAVIFSHCSPFFKPGESDGSPAEQNLFLSFPVISRWKKSNSTSWNGENGSKLAVSWTFFTLRRTNKELLYSWPKYALMSWKDCSEVVYLSSLPRLNWISLIRCSVFHHFMFLCVSALHQEQQPGADGVRPAVPRRGPAVPGAVRQRAVQSEPQLLQLLLQHHR